MIKLTLVKHWTGRWIGRTVSDRWNMRTLGITQDRMSMPDFKAECAEMGFRVILINDIRALPVYTWSDAEIEAFSPPVPAAWYPAQMAWAA